MDALARRLQRLARLGFVRLDLDAHPAVSMSGNVTHDALTKTIVKRYGIALD